MHARKSSQKVRYLFVSLLALIGLAGLVPAQASTTLDASGVSLDFNKGKPSAGDFPAAPGVGEPGAPILGQEYTEPFGDGSILWKWDGTAWDLVHIFQAEGAASSSLDLGEDLPVGEWVDYYEVATINGTQVDARMSVLAIESTGYTVNGTPVIDKLDDADDDFSNGFLLPMLLFNSENGAGYAELKIEFFTDLASGSPQPVTLQNLSFTVYDIDFLEYFEASDFSRYSLGIDTHLTVSEVGNQTKFAELNDKSSSTDYSSVGRVSLAFDSVSSLIFRLGTIEDHFLTTPDFYLDFSTGLSWGGNQGPEVITRVPAESTPVRAAIPYEGPIGLRHQTLSLCVGDNVLVTGQRLDSIKEVTVAGTSVPFEILSNGDLSYSLKDVAAGKQTVRFWVPVNSLYLTDSITVANCSTKSVIDQKVNAGSFKGYVAIYARGYEGQRLSAKVGNDWVVVPSIVNNQDDGTLFRAVEFTGAGYTIAVRIYIDRVLVDTITVTTK